MSKVVVLICRRIALRRRCVLACMFGSLFVTLLFSVLTYERLDNRIVNSVNVHNFPSLRLQEQVHVKGFGLQGIVHANDFASGKLSVVDKTKDGSALDSLFAQQSKRDLMAVNSRQVDSINMSKTIQHVRNESKQDGNHLKSNVKTRHKYVGQGDIKEDKLKRESAINKVTNQLHSQKGLNKSEKGEDFNKGQKESKTLSDNKETDQLKQKLEKIFSLTKVSSIRNDTTKLQKLAKKLTDLIGENSIKEFLSNLKQKEKGYRTFKGVEYPLKVDLKELFSQFKKTKKVKVDIINKPFNILLNPKLKCQMPDDETDSKIFVLFIVKTSPGNFESRKTIRRTWGDEKRFRNMRIVFSMGVPKDEELVPNIQREWNMFNDVLFADYKDTYFNLTLKTTTGINWATKYCANAEYIISVDDDVYVATDFLIQYLEHLDFDRSHRFFGGRLYTTSEPIREGADWTDYYDKWIVSKQEYPWDIYPPYVFGGFAVMSRATLLEFYFAIKFTEMFKFEDVYLGILADRLGITVTDIYDVDSFKTFTTNESFKTLIASHYYTKPREIRQAWECHLGIVEHNIEKLVYCDIMKPMLQNIKSEIDKILSWMDHAQEFV